MHDMSPLGNLILRVMRVACLAAAALLLAFLGLALWQKTSVFGLAGLARQDFIFMGVLGVMAIVAVWLARSIGREMDNPGS